MAKQNTSTNVRHVTDKAEAQTGAQKALEKVKKFEREHKHETIVINSRTTILRRVK